MGVLAAIGGASLDPSPASGGWRAAPCNATPVHWQPRKNIGTRAGLVMPWIQASPRSARVIGYLVYYTPTSRTVELHLPGAVMFTHGRTPEGGTTSIIWVPQRNAGRFIFFQGRRLDGPGSFRQRSGFGSAGTYPSALRVPAPGCWRVTLRSLNLRAQVTFAVYDAP
jgi:hypothetical protein